MADALAVIGQAGSGLAASIRQSATWLGQSDAKSTPPAKLQQVLLITSI